MMVTSRPVLRCSRERGASLLITAFILTLMLGVCAIAIDLSWLYVAHVQAQEAADAAALAGAKAYVDSNYTSVAAPGADFLSPFLAGFVVSDMVGNEATTTAEQFKIGGLAVTSGDVSVSRNDSPSTPMTPQVTVTVSKSVPTFFARAFKVAGLSNVKVSATATAQAYNPSGGSGAAVSTAGVKPWMLPNLDPNHSGSSGNCSGVSGSRPFVNATNGKVCSPGYSLFGSLIGEAFSMKQGSPSAPAPGQFYPIDNSAYTGTAIAPACAASDTYSQAIAGSNTTRFTCGQNVTVSKAALVGVGSSATTKAATMCLIHASGAGLNQGQDAPFLSIFNFSLIPVATQGGSSNPIPGASGKILARTDSLVTVPLYNGAALCSGSGCAGTASVVIVGFLQLYITDVTAGSSSVQSNVDIQVWNAVGCAGNSTGNPAVAPGGTLLPVRLTN